MSLSVLRIVEERFHRDVEGRPIREGRTPPEFLKPDDIEYKQCPYAGSRFQHKNPMNASALRQAGVHWDAMIAALARLRQLHDRVRAVEVPTIMDLWRVSQLGSALPWFYILKNEPVPAFAAALSKTSLGMGIWAQRVFVRMLTQGWEPPPFTPENMVALAEDNGTLIGETEVCSGGEKMLLKYFDVHVTPNPAPGSLELPQLDVLRFGAHYANFKLVLWMYFLARRFVYADAGAVAASFLDSSVEPSDFFIIEPANLADVSPEQRTAWFRTLADLVVPFAADASDLPLRDRAMEIAGIMGRGLPPAKTWAQLDANFGRLIQSVEVGLRGEGRPDDIAVPPDVRDRLIGASPRAIFEAR
jgi:hypothetical protein